MDMFGLVLPIITFGLGYVFGYLRGK